MEKNVTLTEEQIEWIMEQIRSYKEHSYGGFWHVANYDGVMKNWDPGEFDMKPEELEFLKSLVVAMKQPPLTIIDPKCFETQINIEIFLRVKGRLPTQAGDRLTIEICEEFIERFAKHPQHGRWVGHAFDRLADLKGQTG